MDEYITHRMAREEQIYTILKNVVRDIKETKGGSTTTSTSNSTSNVNKSNELSQISQFLSSWDVMTLIYGDTIPFIVKFSAQKVVINHLQKLEKNGKVRSKFPDLWTAVLIEDK